MLSLATTTKFRKDIKRIKKRGFDLALLENVIDRLLCEEPLDVRHKDHALAGDYTGFRECHIQPDWLLVYAVSKERLILTALRTGSHADLFGK